MPKNLYLGAGGRWFDSSLTDQIIQGVTVYSVAPFCFLVNWGSQLAQPIRLRLICSGIKIEERTVKISAAPPLKARKRFQRLLRADQV